MTRPKTDTCHVCGDMYYTNRPHICSGPISRAIQIAQKQTVVEQITAKRGSVYGPFLHNSIVAQNIKAAMRNIPDPNNEGLKWEALPVDVREALDLIALKVSRIVTGDPEYLDNFDDIGGYAKIVADRIRAKQEKKC